MYVLLTGGRLPTFKVATKANELVTTIEIFIVVPTVIRPNFDASLTLTISLPSNNVSKNTKIEISNLMFCKYRNKIKYLMQLISVKRASRKI